MITRDNLEYAARAANRAAAPQADPVAQEPIEWPIDADWLYSVLRFADKNQDMFPDIVEGRVSLDPSQALAVVVALNQPDQSAEVERLRQHCDELESGGWRQYQERIAELERQRDELVEALEEARDQVVSWAAYASEYFQQKHDLAGYVSKLDAALASVKGE